MSKLEFSLDLPASPEKLMTIATNYKKLSEYLPHQLKSIKIIEQNDNETVTEEEITFSTILKNTIRQKTLHTSSKNQIFSEILSGPATGSKITVIFLPVDSGTRVNAKIDLKLIKKAFFLTPLVKKWYKMFLTSVLLKMNTEATNF